MARRIVPDTNLWFSALVHRGVPLAAMDELHLPEFQPLSSAILLEELLATLRKKTKWPMDQIDAAISHVAARCEIIHPTLTIAVCRDPDDNRILECALAGHADVIVSGDKDLLSLGSFQGIPILTARQFLDTLPA